MSNLKIVSANVRGLQDKLKRKQIFIHLKKLKLDICFLQETHAIKKVQKFWRNEWGASIVFANGTSNARGVAILFNSGFEYKTLQCECDPEGRFIIMLIEYEQMKVLLTNVYAPNDDNPHFFVKIVEKILEKDYDHAIWGRDFNKVINPKLDKKGVSKKLHTMNPKLF